MKKTLAIIFIFCFSLTLYAANSAEDKFYEKCSSCHGSSLSLKKKKSYAAWQKTIKRMKKHGLRISSSDSKTISKFLSGGK